MLSTINFTPPLSKTLQMESNARKKGYGSLRESIMRSFRQKKIEEWQ